jgi:hypothetical protein
MSHFFYIAICDSVFRNCTNNPVKCQSARSTDVTAVDRVEYSRRFGHPQPGFAGNRLFGYGWLLDRERPGISGNFRAGQNGRSCSGSKHCPIPLNLDKPGIRHKEEPERVPRGLEERGMPLF